MSWIGVLQWPAMVLTVFADWMVGSKTKPRRKWGFRLFLGSNVLWVAWGVHDHAWALVLLQIALATMNVRGALKNRASAETG